MPVYDAVDFRPPAPTASVTIRSLENGISIPDVVMLMDTGADVSLVAREPIAKLLDATPATQQYELEAFDGTRSWLRSFNWSCNSSASHFAGNSCSLRVGTASWDATC